MVEVVKIQAQGSNRRLMVKAQITTGQQTQQRIGNTYTRYKNPVCGKKTTGENREVTRIITTPRRSGTQRKGERMGKKREELLRSCLPPLRTLPLFNHS